MANTRSAAKRARQSTARSVHNRSARARLRSLALVQRSLAAIWVTFLIRQPRVPQERGYSKWPLHLAAVS